MEGTRLSHDTTTRATVRRRRAADDAALPSLAFDDRDLVSALAFTPQGERLLVGFVGAGVVELRDALDHQPLHRWSMPDANPVTGLVVSADGAVVWAYDGFGERLHTFDLLSLRPEPEASFPLTLGLPDPLDPEARWGRALFHRSADRRMTPNGYVSCAVCHLEGEQDGLVWDFTQRGEGLRNTLPLRGLGAGPFHWSANFDELQDFENDIRLHQDGAGFLTAADWAEAQAPLGPEKAGRSAELDALAAWMRALPGPLRSPWRRADGGRTEAGIRGEALFETHDCVACHPAPSYTDAAWSGGEPVLHDVGTQSAGSGQRLGQPLLGLRTPTLRGAHATGPWLHDGSADTIEAAIRAHVPPLSPNELADLTAFVRELE